MDKITVPSTSLFISSFRMLITNAFFENINNGNSYGDNTILEFSKYYLPIEQLKSLTENLQDFLVYDPYAYFFCKTDEQSIIVSNFINKSNREFPGYYESDEFRNEILKPLGIPTNFTIDKLCHFMSNLEFPMLSFALINHKSLIYHVMQRTKYIDHFIQEGIDDGFEQFIIVASGLDSRGYRLPFKSGSTVFELDLADVLNYKTHVLDGITDNIKKISNAKNVYISCDLNDVADWCKQLERNGFEMSKKTFWLVEGMLPYFEIPRLHCIFSKIGSMSKSGSILLYQDYIPTMGNNVHPNILLRYFEDQMKQLNNSPDEFIKISGFTKSIQIVQENQIKDVLKLKGVVKDHFIQSFYVSGYKP